MSISLIRLFTGPPGIDGRATIHLVVAGGGDVRGVGACDQSQPDVCRREVGELDCAQVGCVYVRNAGAAIVKSFSSLVCRTLCERSGHDRPGHEVRGSDLEAVSKPALGNNGVLAVERLAVDRPVALPERHPGCAAIQ